MVILLSGGYSVLLILIFKYFFHNLREFNEFHNLLWIYVQFTYTLFNSHSPYRLYVDYCWMMWCLSWNPKDEIVYTFLILLLDRFSCFFFVWNSLGIWCALWLNRYHDDKFAFFTIIMYKMMKRSEKRPTIYIFVFYLKK